jgi:hypothetical protein
LLDSLVSALFIFFLVGKVESKIQEARLNIILNKMGSFDLVEIEFGPADFESTLEDEFLIARITKELNAVEDIEQLREGAIKLLQLAVMRQGMIRGLVRRLANLESDVIRTRHLD